MIILLIAHLHGVVRHQEDILYGQGEDVGGEEAGEQQTHRQLVVRQVAVSAHQQGVAWTDRKLTIKKLFDVLLLTKIFVGEQLLHHRVLGLEIRTVVHLRGLSWNISIFRVLSSTN